MSREKDAINRSSDPSSLLHLDPYYLPWVEQLAGLSPEAYLSPDPTIRAKVMAYFNEQPAMVFAPALVREETLNGPHGPFRVRIYTPQSGKGPWPALIWMHGGAFVGGNLDMVEADGVSREVCARTPAVVISVDYHLCNHMVHWPVPHDDCIAVLSWIREHSVELGIDAERLSIGGASAGGCLAAGAALRVRDEGGPRLRSLLLVYPVLYLDPPPCPKNLQMSLRQLPPLLVGGEDPVQNRMLLWGAFLGPTIHHPDPYAVPGEADLAGLPPTLVVFSEYDRLRAEAEAFIAKLREARVPVISHLEPGVLHGHLNLIGRLVGADRTLDAMVGMLTRL
jgi:acetyl esterase